jgi:hypothetical protein
MRAQTDISTAAKKQKMHRYNMPPTNSLPAGRTATVIIGIALGTGGRDGSQAVPTSSRKSAAIFARWTERPAHLTQRAIERPACPMAVLVGVQNCSRPSVPTRSGNFRQAALVARRLVTNSEPCLQPPQLAAKKVADF